MLLLKVLGHRLHGNFLQFCLLPWGLTGAPAPSYPRDVPRTWSCNSHRLRPNSSLPGFCSPLILKMSSGPSPASPWSKPPAFVNLPILFLNVSTLFHKNVPVVACSRDMRAVFSGRAREFSGHGGSDARFNS